MGWCVLRSVVAKDSCSHVLWRSLPASCCVYVWCANFFLRPHALHVPPCRVCAAGCCLLQCAADVTKVFRSPKQLKCYESRDTICSSNETAMIVACRSSAGAVGAQFMVRPGTGGVGCCWAERVAAGVRRRACPAMQACLQGAGAAACLLTLCVHGVLLGVVRRCCSLLPHWLWS